MRVVIIGGGFGGLYCAQSLARSPFQVTLVDRRNFHLFQPLLYQVATGGLSPANIAAPLRSVLKRQRNARVLLGEVTGFDPARRCVTLADGELTYDALVVAAGAVNHFFGHDEWEAVAPGLKTIEDATRMRARILSAFERAEREPDRAIRRELLTFVVIGGGPTGVELAGALAEIARHTLRNEFRSINPAETRVVLLEGGPRVLAAYTADLSAKAQAQLERLGVEVRTGVLVTDIQADRVLVRPAGENGAASEAAEAEAIRCRTALWGAGIRASPLGQALADATGVTLDRAGRVRVARDCSIPRHPDLFVIGDLATMEDDAGRPLPGIAPVAMQQGRYVAQILQRRARGRPSPPFRYVDKGTMATIGRAAAVADIRGLRFSGYLAWLLWLFVHVLFLIEFQNRVLVLMQWAWNYLTWSRSSRLIVGSADARREQA